MSIGSANNRRAALVWLVLFVTTSLVVMGGYLWFDRPVARFIDAYLHWGYRHLSNTPITRIPDPLIPISVLVFVLLGLLALSSRSFSKFSTCAFLCSISVIVAATMKDELKYVFGRTWPKSWLGNNPSFLRDGVYGFNFMHGGTTYQSFPSGHMAALCAASAVLWIVYPQLRWLWFLAAFTVGAVLVGTNYHFLSDVVAGAFVGVSAGWFAAAIWRRASA
jgi:membrane-associated phospholipid phosphatase